MYNTSDTSNDSNNNQGQPCVCKPCLIYSEAHGRSPRTSGHAKRYVTYADCTPCENWLYIR